MAGAIAGGLVRRGGFAAADLEAYDIAAEAAARFTRATGVQADGADPAAKVRRTEAVLLAVKPQTLEAALAPLRGELSGKPVISIVAGVTLVRLAELTGSDRIIRVMPNTPALVGCGAAGFAASPGARPEDLALAEQIFSAVGVAFPIGEDKLDAVTALSGSGPAYVFEFIQALADGGVAEGLPREVAVTLAAQTVLGAAKMVLDTGEHPAVLKDQVTSPAGTTSRALEVRADRGLSGAVFKAVRAAAARSRELGKA